MTKNEIIIAMKQCDNKYKKLRVLAIKIAKEMDDLYEQYTSLSKQLDEINIVENG